jgi:hypothetical protein
MNELTAAINRVIEKHGSLRKAAAVLQVDFAYLWRLQTGRKTNPGPELSRKLGIAKEVTFRKVNGRKAKANAD